MRKLFLFFLLLNHLSSTGQNCSILTATNKVCLGNTLSFSVQFNTGLTATSYAWSFGGSNPGTSSQPAPVFQYPARGTYTPTVTIVFSNSTSCTVSGQAIKVVDRPKADFKITTPTPQCYMNNKTCLLDISTKGLDNAPINTRYALFGDGGLNNSDPSTGPIMCYDYVGPGKTNPSYNNPLGGNYSILLEVTDTNGCTTQKLIKDTVTIWAKMQPISFKTVYVEHCNKTPVTFINTSRLPLSQIKNYKWDFGDGSIATNPWTNFVHTYTQTGNFTGKLMVEDINGCRDTFITNAGSNSKIDSTIYLDKTASCSYKNFVLFKSLNSPPSIVYWAIYKIGNPVRIDTSVNITMDSIHFNLCGQYQIRMYVKLSPCFIRTDTIINIYGPTSVIQTLADPIKNSVQCEITDTVYFRAPPKDNSCFYRNSGIYRMWDFDDDFALPCTTDTKNGINVNINCRYSKDSINVKHAYKAGKERCYYPKLILKDTIRGCADTSIAALKLTQPDAGWDSTINPVRRGLFYIGNPCLLNPLRFSLRETLPVCGREKAWFMPDSVCPGASWIPIDSLAEEFDYTYNATCDPAGNITVGLIIKNGNDKNGMPCYDTAWYHWMLRLLPLNSVFTVDRTNTGCGPWAVKLTLNDTIQDSLTKVIINMDNKFVYVKIHGPTDSIIPSQYYTFTKPGIKNFSAAIYNTRGCNRYSTGTLAFGFLTSFNPSVELLCLNDSITFEDNVHYYSNALPYWKDPLREKAGKEQLLWDVGDGSGFSKKGSSFRFKYSKPGNFRVQLVAIDSLGCKDTFSYPRPIKVTSVRAIIKPMLPRYLCSPQILSFKDQSFYIDSSALYNQKPYDSIVYWNWDFGDGKLTSYLKHPYHDYTSNSSFSVKLVVQTLQGCTDSVTIPILIDGPRPSFDIIGDTVGCAPFKLNLKNTTGYPLINWVWYFRDQNNATSSTQKDTNVNFTYTKGGIYKIYLVGEDTLFNPLTGQIKSCYSVFPDSSNINAPKRQVRVIESLHAIILGPDTVCIHTEFILTAKSSKLIPGYVWIFDTLPPINKLWPDSTLKNRFDIGGNYQIKLYPQTSNSICLDTFVKNINVSEVKADFTINDLENPLIKFANLSIDAVRYEWDFGQPRSGSRNFSTLENPTHSYAGDSGTFLVCLKSFNAQDCYDSICKRTLRSDLRLNIPNVFTPNNDDNNDAFDIDIIGYNFYDITIYNRWGDLVYKGDLDGLGNDGNNWNGKNYNNGLECPAGVYFFIFKYKMVNMSSPKIVHGTVTLIRE